MRSVYEQRTEDAREIERNLLRGAARICGPSAFGTCWKALHPSPLKPAVELAKAVGCSIRTAEYELSGQHDPSPQSILALNKIITPPWKRG